MSILNVIKYPNKILKERAEPIEEISEEIEILAHDMLETMYANRGIGLAGNQVGVLQRIIVIDLQENEDEEDEGYDSDIDNKPYLQNKEKSNQDYPMIFINPEIIWSSDELAERDEGCLSIPKISGTIKRPEKVKVSYINLDGKKQIIEADGLLATCLQHEIDHLNGILFIDRMSQLKRDLILKKYKKAQEKARK